MTNPSIQPSECPGMISFYIFFFCFSLQLLSLCSCSCNFNPPLTISCCFYHVCTMYSCMFKCIRQRLFSLSLSLTLYFSGVKDVIQNMIYYTVVLYFFEEEEENLYRTHTHIQMHTEFLL